MRTPRILLAAVSVAALRLAVCNDTEPGAAGEPTGTSPSPSAEAPTPSGPSSQADPEPESTVVDITIDGDDIEPLGETVQADLGEPITLRITSDREGELHVHSTPEQEVSFGEGTTEAELTIDQPGVVQVEEHHSRVVVVQLEVS
jgi:hypothetical protein